MHTTIIILVLLFQIASCYVYHLPYKIISTYSTKLHASQNFDSDVRTSLDDFDQILESIAIFKKIYNDVRIPLKFEVPAETPWPYNVHGLRLGKRLEKILSSSEFFEQNKDKVRQLESLGFKADISSLVDDWDIILDALKKYYEIFGNLRVSVKYVVPGMFHFF